MLFISCNGRIQLAPPEKQIRAEVITVGDQDITPAGSQCILTANQTVKATVILEESDTSTALKTAEIRLISRRRGKDAMMQSRKLDMKRTKGQLELSCEMQITQHPCEGKLQVRSENEILIERAVKVIEAKQD